jgi:hypothetical protein
VNEGDCGFMNKNSFKKVLLLVIILYLVSFTLTGCRPMQYRIGFIKFDRKDSTRMSYKLFSGIECRYITLQSQSLLALNYNAIVNRGNLEIVVYDPARQRVWIKSLDHDDTDEVLLRIERGGTYRILILGNQAAGAVAITWLVTNHADIGG